MPAKPKRATLDEQRENVRALLLGDPGSGKTTSAAAMARLGRVLFVNAEGGLKQRPLEKLGIPTANIVAETATTYDDLDELFWEVKGEFDDDPDAYVGAVIDSGSELVQRFLDVIRKDEYARAVAKADRRGEELTITRWFTDRAYYGTMSGQMRELLRHFKDLPCHLCITALPRREQDDDGAVKYGPQVNPAIAGDLLGMVDVVGYCEAEGDLFTARFRPTKTKVAKDRFGALPHRMVDPHFDRIVGYVNDEIKEGGDKLQARLGDDGPAPSEEVAEAKGDAEGTRPRPRNRPGRTR